MSMVRFGPLVRTGDELEGTMSMKMFVLLAPILDAMKTKGWTFGHEAEPGEESETKFSLKYAIKDGPGAEVRLEKDDDELGPIFLPLPVLEELVRLSKEHS